MNILIADDNPTNLKLLSAQLEAEGMNVVKAVDGTKAMVSLDREMVDVVISDVVMPNMDGYQLCYAIRSTERLKTIPFILYSNALISESSPELGSALGADAFLNKPAPVGDIVSAINKVLAQRGGCSHQTDARAPRLKESPSKIEDQVREVAHEAAATDDAKRRLLEINHKLLLGMQRLEALEAELRKSNEELERRVVERTADLQAANEALESFSYSISHDLRTPLRTIDGFSQAVIEDYGSLLPEEGQRDLQTIRRGAQRMGILIDDLLAFSRLGATALNKQEIDIAELVGSVWTDLSPQWKDRQIELIIEELGMCEGDPALLKQVWINLLGNAIKYTRHREKAKIEIGCSAQQAEMVYFVRDNGAGFDMAYADNLFGVFQRLHSAAEFEGTGVGLAIVKRIIQRHGGRIWAQAEPDHGACFYFKL